jgi:hypothetical protein
MGQKAENLAREHNLSIDELVADSVEIQWR